MASISVVILNYNGSNYLKDLLPSVLEYSREAEVIVADNASRDDSTEVMKKDFPDVCLIEIEENLGFAGGYNEILKRVEADYFVLLNSDVEVTANWLTPLVTFMESNPDYAGCQPKIKDYNHRNTFEYAGACGGFIDSLGYPYCRGRLFDTTEIDTGQYNKPLDVFWTSGACMMIRSKVYKEAGGLDDDFFAHMEEIDLCWRIQSMGLKLRIIPESTVYHIGGGTLSKVSPFKTYLNFRNGLALLIKNLPLSALILKLPIRIVLDWVAGIHFLLSGEAKHFRSVARAHLWIVAHLKSTCSKRKKTSDLHGRTSIVWDYFVKRKHHYNRL